MKSREFYTGIRKTMPLMIGVIPFGLAFGIMSIQAGLSVFEAGFMSAVVFAGSAQFMSVGMLIQGVDYTFIIFSTLLINLRHLLMGLSLSPYLNRLKTPWLSLLAFGMVDESYAVTIDHYHKSGKEDGNPYFFLGSAVGMYIFWIGSSIVGGTLGRSISNPLEWGLDFAMPATFLSILMPQIKSLRILLVIIIAGTCSVTAYTLIPGKWYIIIATVMATVIGAVMETFQEGRDENCEQVL